jgi:DNA-binding protein YbaB
MFDKLKELNKLRELKKALENERKEAEINGVRVVVNGRMEVEEIKLNSELSSEEQEKLVKECVNKAMREMQMEAAKKMFNQ